MSLLDHPGGEAVKSLRYFAGLREEVRMESFLAAFRRHGQCSFRRCEWHWQERRLEQEGECLFMFGTGRCVLRG